jgi:hypothetical protein
MDTVSTSIPPIGDGWPRDFEQIEHLGPRDASYSGGRVRLVSSSALNLPSVLMAFFIEPVETSAGGGEGDIGQPFSKLSIWSVSCDV